MSWTDLTLELPAGPVRAQTHGQGPTLIWTHGVFHPIDVDDHSSLGRVLLAVEGFRVVRYDTRGHGRTPPGATDAAHRWDRLADELLALADALGVDRFVAGGISMGAAITLHAAVRARARVAGMILLAPPTAWETRPTAHAEYRHLASLPGPAEVAAKVEDDLRRALGEVPPALMVMVEHLRRSNPVALGRVLRAAAESDLPARADVAGLTTPSLLLPWDGDPGHPMSTAREIAACLPHARLAPIANIDDTTTMSAAIAAFLAPLARQL